MMTNDKNIETFFSGAEMGPQERSTCEEESIQKLRKPERILDLLQSVLSEDLVKAIQAVYQINIESETNAYLSLSFILDLKNGERNIPISLKNMVSWGNG